MLTFLTIIFLFTYSFIGVQTLEKCFITLFILLSSKIYKRITHNKH